MTTTSNTISTWGDRAAAVGTAALAAGAHILDELTVNGVAALEVAGTPKANGTIPAVRILIEESASVTVMTGELEPRNGKFYEFGTALFTGGTDAVATAAYVRAVIAAL